MNCDAGPVDGINAGRRLRADGWIRHLVRENDRGAGRGSRMTVVALFTGVLLVYLIYALLHPEKF